MPKPQYRQKFRKSWLQDAVLKSWLQMVDSAAGPTAKCKYCGSIMRNHYRDLRKHATSNKHMRNSKNVFEDMNSAPGHDPSDDEHEDGTEDSLYSPPEDVFVKSARDSEETCASLERRPNKRRVTGDRSRRSTTRIRNESMDGEDSSSIAGDDIEHFGHYVTALLRKMPRPFASQMQLDILTLILNAQSDYEAKQAAAEANTVTSEGSHRENHQFY